MQPAQGDEWSVIESLLPTGWKEAAREKKAFRRARYTMAPGPLLRVLLFHAVASPVRFELTSRGLGGRAPILSAGRVWRPE